MEEVEDLEEAVIVEEEAVVLEAEDFQEEELQQAVDLEEEVMIAVEEAVIVEEEAVVLEAEDFQEEEQVVVGLGEEVKDALQIKDLLVDHIFQQVDLLLTEDKVVEDQEKASITRISLF